MLGALGPLRTDDLEKLILRMFKGQQLYGYEIHKRLKSDGVEVEMSRLYRVLNGMLKRGYLEGHWEKSNLGPDKRMYRIGERGRKEIFKILLDAIKMVHESYGEYLLSLPPEKNVINKVSRLLTDKLKGQCNIAYVSLEYSPIHAKLLSSLQSMVPQGKIYYIKPSSVEADFKLENISTLDGEYINIPLRNSYLDLLFVIDVPKRAHLDDALREWCRVLSQNGKLGIITPSALVLNEDILSIGDYIEKLEHETIEGAESIDRNFVEASLKRFFQRVEAMKIVHMILFLAHGKAKIQ